MSLGPASCVARDRPMASELPNYNTRSLLRDDLARMGSSAGDTVMVHAATSNVGPMLNGPDALSTTLLDVIGPEGTLLVDTSLDSVHDGLLDDDGRVRAQCRDHVPGFDPQASRAVRMNGVIAEFVRTVPGAKRSGNPGASVAAIGRLADWILRKYGCRRAICSSVNQYRSLIHGLLAEPESAPCAWKTCFAISSPIVITSDTDASPKGDQHLHSGTSMPSGGVHPIRSRLSNQWVLTLRYYRGSYLS
jgi:hypothetical protein